jgi:predicted nucleotidyltransferase
MPDPIRHLLAEFKKGLAQIYGARLKAVYLFGSYARGDYNANSDLDVMIVLDDYQSYWDELVRTSQLASDLSLEYDITLSRTIMREDQWLKGDLPLLANVRAEGIPA